MLVQSDPEHLQRQVSQLQIAGFSGYDIFALEDEDLAGSDPVLFDEQLLAELEDYIVAKMTQLEIPEAAISIIAATVKLSLTRDSACAWTGQRRTDLRRRPTS
ncbi:MAG: hypothetical protein R2856_07265 [Caldilineaceae bacterium]